MAFIKCGGSSPSTPPPPPISVTVIILITAATNLSLILSSSGCVLYLLLSVVGLFFSSDVCAVIHLLWLGLLGEQTLICFRHRILFKYSVTFCHLQIKQLFLIWILRANINLIILSTAQYMWLFRSGNNCLLIPAQRHIQYVLTAMTGIYGKIQHHRLDRNVCSVEVLSCVVKTTKKMTWYQPNMKHLLSIFWLLQICKY